VLEEPHTLDEEEEFTRGRCGSVVRLGCFSCVFCCPLPTTCHSCTRMLDGSAEI